MPKSKITLEALEGDVWGPPDNPSHLVSTIHMLRKRCLDEFSADNVRVFIGQGFSLPVVMPMALDILEGDPWIEATFYEGDLLSCVCRQFEYLSGEAQLLQRVIAVVKTARNTCDTGRARQKVAEDFNVFLQRIGHQGAGK